MEKHWLKSYPEGVPHEIQPEQYRSLTQLLEESFKKNASRPFSVCMERWMTYGQLDDLSAALGAWLQAQGLEPGARVAIMLPNIPQFAVTMAAVLRAGYTCVNVNPLYTARELEHQLKDSGATVIVILENFAKTLEEVIDRTPIKRVVMASMGDLLGFWFGNWITFAVRHLAKMVPRLQAAAVRRAHGHDVQSCHRTGHLDAAEANARRHWIRWPSCNTPAGPRGCPKGAELTHRNIVAAILQAEAWFTPALKRIGDVSKSNSIAALPLYHIFALTLCLLAIRWGSHLTLIPNPRDFGKFVEVLKKRPFHLFPAVNTLFNALLQHPQFKSVDFSQLCLSQAGGMAASEGTARQWRQATGCAMVEGWGMSETCAIGTNNVVVSKDFTGTIGLPLPSIEIAIKDDDGNSLLVGESGEICIKGPNVMRGYYEQPAENEKAFTSDGFMRTGDIGIMDDARLHQDRRSQEGHDPRQRLQCLSERTGECDFAVPRRRRMRRDRHSGRETGRGHQGLRRQERPDAVRGRRCEVLPAEPHGLQGAQVRRVPGRPAQDQRGQDLAPGAAVGQIDAAALSVSLSHVGYRRSFRMASRFSSAAGCPANNILFHGQRQTALVDSGYCTHAEQTLALIREALGGRPLDLLLNTHLHSDHCGGNAALQSAYPDVETLIPPGLAAACAQLGPGGADVCADRTAMPALPHRRLARAADRGSIWETGLGRCMPHPGMIRIRSSCSSRSRGS